MDKIIEAAIVAATQLVQLIFLGVKSNTVTQEEIDNELKRILEKQKELEDKWWGILGNSLNGRR